MNKNYLILGAPGTGKTYQAKKIVVDTFKSGLLQEFHASLGMESDKGHEQILSGEVNKSFNNLRNAFPELVVLVEMHESYSYDDFVEGIYANTKDGKIEYQSSPRLLLNVIDKMNKYNLPGFIILDDVNRGDFTAVLGETLDALDNRNTSITLKSGSSLRIPDNLYFIATYNTLNTTSKIDISVLRRFKTIKLVSSTDKLKEVFKESAFSVNNPEDNYLIDRIAGTEYRIGEYERYNRPLQQSSFINHYNREDYIIGFSYFLPGSADKVDKAEEVILQKIHYQVIPVLNQYAKEGLIKRDEIPAAYRSDTAYTRERKMVREPKIKLHLDSENSSSKEWRKRIFVDKEALSFPEGKDVKGGRAQGINNNYLLVSEVVNALVQHNLINDWQLMDILLTDNSVAWPYNAHDKGAAVLAEESVAGEIVLQNAGRNHQSFYAGEGVVKYLHLEYNRKKYRYITKINGNGDGQRKIPYNIEKCFAKKETQNCKPGQLIKMLVYRYFMEFKHNLLHYIDKNPSDIEAVSDLNQLNDDIEIIKKMTTEDSTREGRKTVCHKGKPYYVENEIVESTGEYTYFRSIYNVLEGIPTWKNMQDGSLKGVYLIMNQDYAGVVERTGIRQMIFQGPPGTSKTYMAKQFILDRIMDKDSLFSPDYRADLLKYLKDNCFEDIGPDEAIITDNEKYEKTVAALKKKALETHKLQLVNGKYSRPEKVVGDNKVFWDVIQFHPAYCYEDFVRGITVSTPKSDTIPIKGHILNGNFKYPVELSMNSGIRYETVNKTFGALCDFASSEYGKECKFYLLIDEINRANLSAVFGELIYALEYRGEPVSVPYEIDGGVLHSEKNAKQLIVNDNIYIIGTMNTADKSIGGIDYAIRRRFLFFSMLPDIRYVVESLGGSSLESSPEIKAYIATEMLFESNFNDYDYQREDIQIGHTYFLRKGEKNADLKMQDRFLFQVLPIIQEYIKDGIINEDNKDNDVIIKLFEVLHETDGQKQIEIYNGLLEEVSKTKEYENIIKEYGKKDPDDEE